MKVLAIVDLCENQYRKRADGALKRLIELFRKLLNVIGRNQIYAGVGSIYPDMSSVTKLLGILEDLGVYDSSVPDFLSDDMFVINMDMDSGVSNRYYAGKGNMFSDRIIPAIREFNEGISDLGIDGEAILNVNIAKKTAVIDLRTMAISLREFITRVLGYNNGEKYLRSNVDVLITRVERIIDNLTDMFAKSREVVINNFGLEIKYNQKTVTIEYKLGVHKKGVWGGSLPEKYNFHPTIRSGVEDLLHHYFDYELRNEFGGELVGYNIKHSDSVHGLYELFIKFSRVKLGRVELE